MSRWDFVKRGYFDKLKGTNPVQACKAVAGNYDLDLLQDRHDFAVIKTLKPNTAAKMTVFHSRKIQYLGEFFFFVYHSPKLSFFSFA